MISQSNSASTSPVQPAQREPAHTPKPPGVRRWSSKAVNTSAWRFGSISLAPISNFIKALATRSARIAPLTTPPSEVVTPIRASHELVVRPLDSQIKKAVQENLKAMVRATDNGGETDESGICASFTKDVLRGIDILDRSQLGKGIHKEFADAEKQKGTRESTLKLKMADFGTSNFGGDKTVMEVFTKIAHQGAFAPILENLNAVMGIEDYGLQVNQRRAFSLNDTQKSFHLRRSSMTEKAATLVVDIRLDASITASQKSGVEGVLAYDPQKSRLGFLARIEVEIPLDRTDKSGQGRNENASDRKHAMSAQSESSPKPAESVKIKLIDHKIAYSLVAAAT